MKVKEQSHDWHTVIFIQIQQYDLYTVVGVRISCYNNNLFLVNALSNYTEIKYK